MHGKTTDEELKQRLTAVLHTYADEKQERAQKVQPPEAVWEEMKRALLKGEIETAIQHFSTSTADDYRESFKSMTQADLARTIHEMGPLAPVERDGNEATYCFKSKVDGVTLTFPVHFGNGLFNHEWTPMATNGGARGKCLVFSKKMI